MPIAIELAMCRFAIFACVLAMHCAAKAPDSRKELQDRIAGYMKLRKEALSHVPKLKAKAEPEDIHAHKLAEAKAIRAARAGAKHGDVLTPRVQQYLKSVVRSEMRGQAGKPAREAAKTGNPTIEGPAREVALVVNATYPDSAPLSTVPPTLLLRLPKLPKELEFRFVGRHLALRDAGASIIVDFVLNAMP